VPPNQALLDVITGIWAAGYAACVLAVVSILFNVSILRLRPVFLVILIAATCGAAVSALGVVRLLGVKIPSWLLFAGESTMLNFAAWLNVILYLILFIWMVNRGLGDFADRVSEFLQSRKPVRKALAAEAAADYAAAIAFYERHLAGNPEDTDALRHYAACLANLGRYHEAVDALRRICSLVRGLRALTAGVEIVHVLSFRLGDQAAAEKETDRLRALYAATPFGRELEARLDALSARGRGD
jgi:tetratricopeptide (TPR) repeat protein